MLVTDGCITTQCKTTCACKCSTVSAHLMLNHKIHNEMVMQRQTIQISCIFIRRAPSAGEAVGELTRELAPGSGTDISTSVDDQVKLHST